MAEKNEQYKEPSMLCELRDFGRSFGIAINKERRVPAAETAHVSYDLFIVPTDHMQRLMDALWDIGLRPRDLFRYLNGKAHPQSQMAEHFAQLAQKEE